MALQDKIRRIDNLKKQLDGLLPMPVEQQQKLDEKLRLEFHYNTNHIEGNTLTYSETKLAILFDQVSEGHSLREFEEMKASDVAYKYVQGLARETERPLTESFIKELNQILLVREFYKDAITESGEPTKRLISIGEYKTQPNHVQLQNGEIFHYASVAETPAMMTDMVGWYREEEEKKEHHTIILAALLHYRFVRIHPFDDGNGRVSRLLMNYVLFKNGYPPIVIKSEDKSNYLRALNKADAGDETAFIEYIADQLIWSMELSVKAAKGEDIEEQQDWKKKLAVLDRELSGNGVIQKVKSQYSDKEIVEIVFKFIDDLWDRLEKSFSEYFVFVEAFYDTSPKAPGLSLRPLKKDNLDSNIASLPYHPNEYRDTMYFQLLFKNFRKNGMSTFDIPVEIAVDIKEVGMDFSYLSDGTAIGTVLYDKINDFFMQLVEDLISNEVVEKIQLTLAQSKSN